MSEFQFYCGLDLGQVQDYSAVVIAEQQETTPVQYHLRTVHRFPLRTAYTSIVAEVVQALSQPALPGRTALLVDATGVGKAVVDIFQSASLPCPLYAVTITGGEKVSREKDDFHVPKRDLASVIGVLFEQERVKIARGFPLEDIFKEELKNFGRKIDPKTANDSYGAWREGQHDDLVLATALALWGGGQKLKRKKMFEGMALDPQAAPRVTVTKINDIYDEITVRPATAEETRQAQEGWRWQDILYGRHS